MQGVIAVQDWLVVQDWLGIGVQDAVLTGYCAGCVWWSDGLADMPLCFACCVLNSISLPYLCFLGLLLIQSLAGCCWW